MRRVFFIKERPKRQIRREHGLGTGLVALLICYIRLSSCDKPLLWKRNRWLAWSIFVHSDVRHEKREVGRVVSDWVSDAFESLGRLAR